MQPIRERIKWSTLKWMPGFSIRAKMPPIIGGMMLTVKAKGRTARHQSETWDIRTSSKGVYERHL
jgi:hypothetical protein